ncbi:MAG: hypothetical protein NZL93_03315, partial [Chthoniobacterales bacterium]|nr:hypothetical protein [Chthoniobacterales bacterium]
ICRFLNPLGNFMGLNGTVLLAYLIGIPANEIVLPAILMLTVLVEGIGGVGAGAGVLFEADDPIVYKILTNAGWTSLTAVCLMLFSLCHNPCSTTLFTIYKETGSWRWTLLAAMLPLIFGFVLCSFVALIGRTFFGF